MGRASTHTVACPYSQQSLHQQHIALLQLDFREAALAAIQEAMEIWRDMAEQLPALNSNLAGPLSNLSGGLSRLGFRKDALATIHEAIEISESWLRINPSTTLVSLHTPATYTMWLFLILASERRL